MKDCTWWPNVFTSLLVLVGWFAVHFATLSRERRKERRETAKSAVDALNSIASDASAFHTALTFDAHEACLLRYNTEKVIRTLQRKPLNDLDLSLGRMVKLRKSITLKNIDPSIFSPQNIDSPILQDIRAATDDLVDAIEAARDSHWA